jgi:hypothetical protein
LARIFSWLEREATALTARQHSSRDAQDGALRHFLQVLVWFHAVILQEVALLYPQHPGATIFKFGIFTSPAFRASAATSASRMEEVEQAAQLAFNNLLEHLVTSSMVSAERSPLSR